MDRMDQIVEAAQREYGVRVKRWRKNMSGRAWREIGRDGRLIRWIESPRPRTPISLSIFLHEIGHHAVGFERFKKRCEEEFFVWQWALGEMRKYGVEPDEKVHRRVELSMRYALSKAIRRGIKQIPEPLAQYLPLAA